MYPADVALREYSATNLPKGWVENVPTPCRRAELKGPSEFKLKLAGHAGLECVAVTNPPNIFADTNQAGTQGMGCNGESVERREGGLGRQHGRDSRGCWYPVLLKSRKLTATPRRCVAGFSSLSPAEAPVHPAGLKVLGGVTGDTRATVRTRAAVMGRIREVRRPKVHFVSLGTSLRLREDRSAWLHALPSPWLSRRPKRG